MLPPNYFKLFQVKIDDCALDAENAATTLTNLAALFYNGAELFVSGCAVQVEHRNDILRRDAALLFHQFDNPVNHHSALFMSFWSWHR